MATLTERRYKDYCLQRNSRCEAPPKAANAIGPGSGTASFFLENLWQIHHSVPDTKYFDGCPGLVKNQPVLESVHAP
jgi:hypothetical protein